MTSKLEVVSKFLEEAWSNPPSSNVEASMATYSDDFAYLDENGNVLMDKQAYIGMGQLTFSAFNDFRWVLEDLREEDDGVIMTGHFEGTHTGDLDLSAMGFGVIPASGKEIVWSEAIVKWRVRGDKIVSLQPHGGSGGIEEFLAPLGVTPPSA